VTFNVVRLREYLPLGQRVMSINVDMRRGGGWQELGRATSIGNCRLIRGPRVVTSAVRVRVTGASVCPALSDVALFSEVN
jgi:alpha-L-fucosidase